ARRPRRGGDQAARRRAPPVRRGAPRAARGARRSVRRPGPSRPPAWRARPAPSRAAASRRPASRAAPASRGRGRPGAPASPPRRTRWLPTRRAAAALANDLAPRWTFPSFLACRVTAVTLSSLPSTAPPGSRHTWSLLHAGFGRALPPAAQDANGAAMRAAPFTYSTAQGGLGRGDLNGGAEDESLEQVGAAQRGARDRVADEEWTSHNRDQDRLSRAVRAEEHGAIAGEFALSDCNFYYGDGSSTIAAVRLQDHGDLERVRQRRLLLNAQGGRVGQRDTPSPERERGEQGERCSPRSFA